MASKIYRQCCRRHDKCPAYICPLDSQWRKVRHTKGDPICILLLCMSKAGGGHVIEEYIPDLSAKRFGQFCEEITQKHENIAMQFAIVANTPMWTIEGQEQKDKAALEKKKAHATK